jgi:hypothetical protein
MPGIQFKMKNRLIRKFEKAQFVSEETAKTFEEANLNEQEQYWLGYFAGSFFGSIKKPKTIDTTSERPISSNNPNKNFYFTHF